MKPIILVFTLVLTAAGFGAGLYVGRHSAKPAATAIAAEPGAAEVSTEAQKLPAITVKPRATSPSEKNVTRMSLAEVETALLELRGLSRSKTWERMNEIVKAIDPADFPVVFGLVGKVSQEMQSSARSAIIARWAETDPRAAMEAGERA